MSNDYDAILDRTPAWAPESDSPIPKSVSKGTPVRLVSRLASCGLAHESPLSNRLQWDCVTPIKAAADLCDKPASCRHASKLGNARRAVRCVIASGIICALIICLSSPFFR